MCLQSLCSTVAYAGKLSSWQLDWVPPSLRCKAGGLSFPALCPNEKFSLDIVMYLLGKIHIICLKSIRSSLCSSVAQCQGDLSTSQWDPFSRSVYPSGPTLMQPQNCVFLPGIHQGLPETRTVKGRGGSTIQCDTSSALVSGSAAVDVSAIAFVFAENDNAFVLVNCHIPNTSGTSIKQQVLQKKSKTEGKIPSLALLFW